MTTQTATETVTFAGQDYKVDLDDKLHSAFAGATWDVQSAERTLRWELEDVKRAAASALSQMDNGYMPNGHGYGQAGADVDAAAARYQVVAQQANMLAKLAGLTPTESE